MTRERRLSLVSLNSFKSNLKTSLFPKTVDLPYILHSMLLSLSVSSTASSLFVAHVKLCVNEVLYGQCACVCGFLYMYVSVHVCIYIYMLRIVSKDKILHFINTVVIIINIIYKGGLSIEVPLLHQKSQEY